MREVSIKVTSVTHVGEQTHHAILQVGDLEVESNVIDDGELPVRGIHVENALFHDIIGLCGLWKEFGRDFCDNLDSKGRDLPWDYGNHDADEISRAVEHHANSA